MLYVGLDKRAVDDAQKLFQPRQEQTEVVAGSSASALRRPCWIKTVAGQEKTSFHRRDRVEWAFTLQSLAAAQADSGGRLMAKAPRFAKAFAGRWRIVEMDN